MRIAGFVGCRMFGKIKTSNKMTTTVIEQNRTTGHYSLISGSLPERDILTFYNGRYFGLHSDKWVLSTPNECCIVNNAKPKVFVSGLNGEDRLN